MSKISLYTIFVCSFAFDSVYKPVNIFSRHILREDFRRLDLKGEFLSTIPGIERTQDMEIACLGIELTVLELLLEPDCQLGSRRKLP